MKTFVVVLFLLLKCATSAKYEEIDWCTINCDGIQHTMCIYKKGGAETCAGAENGLTESEKSYILKLHNKMRAKVARGDEHPQPPATDMNELLWDDDLEDVAQRWAEQCQFSNPHDQCRSMKTGRHTGQNVAKYWSSGAMQNRTSIIETLVQYWYDEVYIFDEKLVNGDWSYYNGTNPISHYTAFVWAATTHVGCGISFIRDGEWDTVKLVCNYYPGGNMISDPVYTIGKTASDCCRESIKYRGLCRPKHPKLPEEIPSNTTPSVIHSTDMIQKQILDMKNYINKVNEFLTLVMEKMQRLYDELETSG